MVHALREIHRVLKPNGLLLDLRPMPVHRRIGILPAGAARLRYVGEMTEKFDEDLAATRAIEQVLRDGLFSRSRQTTFQLDRRMDTPEELQRFVSDLPAGSLSEELWREVERVYVATRGKKEIVIRAPLRLVVLRKSPPIAD